MGGGALWVIVKNVTPEGLSRTARVKFEKPGEGEDRVVGQEMRVEEEGEHTLVLPSPRTMKDGPYKALHTREGRQG